MPRDGYFAGERCDGSDLFSGDGKHTRSSRSIINSDASLILRKTSHYDFFLSTNVEVLFFTHKMLKNLRGAYSTNLKKNTRLRFFTDLYVLYLDVCISQPIVGLLLYGYAQKDMMSFRTCMYAKQ